jgi:chromosome segregation ATPase
MELGSLMAWSLIIDGLLILLLLVSIYCAVRLNKRLSILRSDKSNLEKLIQQFEVVTEKADASLSGLRRTADQVKNDLDDATAKSQGMRDELAFLIERADLKAERLAKMSSPTINSLPEGQKKSMTNSSPLSSGANLYEPLLNGSQLERKQDYQDESVEINISESEAERDLMNALRKVR